MFHSVNLLTLTFTEYTQLMLVQAVQELIMSLSLSELAQLQMLMPTSTDCSRHFKTSHRQCLIPW